MALPMKKKAATMKTAMKASSTMKAMKKTMKAKRVSTVARGHGAKSRVFKGKKEKTSGGLTKDKLTLNKHGKVVSKARSATSKKNYANSKLKSWGPCLWLRAHRRQERQWQGSLCQGEVPLVSALKKTWTFTQLVSSGLSESSSCQRESWPDPRVRTCRFSLSDATILDLYAD
eukprot:CAMPEP_0195039748 /NCGR_PEP_ID=MMETSP0326_2-20130528/79971_1 /TAXON_ID=2866 ORGANISM="Crypthecodinium cohnii, Strain Seligo" /NCGR_SAMPLE_ID=MMETSP0326_2 /ASSEMBLY_ACC=CAM_ASM_000348 /LENGTH=172 /DNA_ID=CAMNT_0040066633 /DNA_START=82 /DNA_END=600 /DNA_ORIENTATION=+